MRFTHEAEVKLENPSILQQSVRLARGVMPPRIQQNPGSRNATFHAQAEPESP
ncbi:hypothetical protein A2U01_0077495, partial [Trifolium medium]|nr:hypothetical protein [Trifolium medium]